MMYHTKYQQACLLCHLAVQVDEYVATTLGDAQQPLFRPYKHVYCQKIICYLCANGQGEASYCIHRDCYRYYRTFFPNSSLRLRDLLELWPGTLDFLTQQNSDTEKDAYIRYFVDTRYRPVGDGTENNLINLLWHMTNKLPAELRYRIAELSWPCALQKPVVILREGRSLEEFSERKMKNENNILEYTGEPVSVACLDYLGFSYVTSLRIEKKTTVFRRDDLSIAVTRDNVGILSVDFQGKFRFKRRGCWYKVMRISKDHLKLRVCIKNIVTDFELANVESPWNPYWNVPLSHPPTVSMWYISDRDASHPNFMRYVELRNNTKGLIVSCTFDGIISISTSIETRSLQSILDEKQGVNQTIAVRIYFPIAENEVIHSAWVRELNNDMNIRHPAIVLSTSLQRTCTFGPYIPPEQRNIYWHQPLVPCKAQITGFCYNDKGILSSGQVKIGVTHENESFVPLSDFPFHTTRTPPNSWIPQWFQSSGIMTGVEHIQLYTDNKKPHKPTVGMLLIYKNHTESLGQLGYECDVESFKLTGSMYFLSGQTEMGPYTKIVCNRKMGEGWSVVPRTAEIVWWFTPSCSQLEIVKE